MPIAVDPNRVAVLGDHSAAYLVRNPESEVNGAVVDVTAAAVAAEPRIPHLVTESIGNANYPRPSVVGSVQWFIHPGEGIPIHAIAGDIVTEATAEPVPWTPLDHPYILAWWDPQSLTVGDGGAVSVWRDRTPHLWQAVQPSGVLQPTLDMDGLNGHRGLLFGGGKRLLTGILPTQNRQPLTTYAVIAGGPAVVSGGSDFFLDRMLDATVVGGAAGRSAANKWTYVNGATSTSSVDSDSAPRIFKVVEASDATTVYINDVEVATTSPTTGRLTFNRIVFGARGDGLNPWEGLIGDVAMFQAPVLGATNVLMMEYLTTKYGL